MRARRFHMRETYVLYTLPFLARVVLGGGVWWKAAVSQLPLLLVLPSLALPRLVRDELREHVLRHAVYAWGFTVAAVTSLDVAYVWDARHAAEIVPLVAFALVGCATLWWFVLAHLLENVADPRLRTHQGDVTVLPLTLVAFATFVRDVPDAAFLFTRSTLFFVPVVVAWATLFFIAFQGFATQRATTHAHPGFVYHASASLVVATVHLLLIEARAAPTTFQFFPPAAALFAQAMVPYAHRPTLRPRRHAGVVAVACAGFAVPTRRVYLLPVACAVAALVVPHFAGRRWVLPAALLAAVGAWELHGYTAFTDALGLFAAHYLVLAGVELVCPAVHAAAPPPAAPRDDGREPQRNHPFVRALRALGAGAAPAPPPAPLPPHPHCPRAFHGAWEMRGVGWAMRYLVVQHLTWSPDGKRARMWLSGGVVYDASLLGWVTRLLCALQVTEITVVDERWVRTDMWYLPVLRLFPTTHWVYVAAPNVLLRVAYDRTGRLKWKYRLVRS